MVHKQKRLITHTTLHHGQSALFTFTHWQIAIIIFLIFQVIFGLVLNPLITVISIIALLSGIYFVDVVFNLYVILKSLYFPPELTFDNLDLKKLSDSSLPTYSILCPLYREAKVLPDFLDSINKLDWPKDKLEVLLLLEENDEETISAAASLKLPDYVHTIIVPDSEPKTKPKACNFGLSKASGEYLVVFDAEDKPEPDQLKKAYLGFQQVPRNVVCLQAKLNYFNPHQNLLTRLFSAEYSLWFDVVLTGLQSINTAIPLGGTSNHFKTKILKDLEGWDPFNVTEDCDLGVRLFKAGYRTAIIDSTTWEEANSNVKNWLRQRSRWIKGYLQTYLVHNRNPIKFVREHGIHAFIFQLIIGARMSFMLINPLLWLLTISYFSLYAIVGPTIESFYPAPVFYMAVFSLVFGNFMYIYNYMIGCAKRREWSLIKFVYLIPFYWLMASVAATIALYQLIVKPHYWEKTIHGFHIAPVPVVASNEQDSTFSKIHSLARSGMATGGALILASVFGNLLNFTYNAYLGRRVSVEDFGLVSLVGSFFYLSTVPVGALGKTVTHRAAFLLGKYQTPIKKFWSHIRLRAILSGVIVTLIWLALTPVMAVFFNSPSYEPFFLFAPVWLIGVTAAVDSGFLSGNLKFKALAVLVVVEALAKFLAAFIFVETGNPHFVYAATPIGMALAFLAGWFFVTRIKQEKKITESNTLYFPNKFFVTSIFTKFSLVAFLSFDLILAKHYLAPEEAGLYALLSLAGKMIFFSGSLFSQFINPLISKEEGAQVRGSKLFHNLFSASIAFSLFAYFIVGLFGSYTIPLLLGEKAFPILYLLPIYGLGMMAFSIAASLVTYYQVRRKYILSVASLVLAIAQIIGIFYFHANLEQIVLVMAAVGVASFVLMLLLHLIYHPLVMIARVMVDLLGIFTFLPSKTIGAQNLRILIFNWRDTKHTWAGGAEVYIHELAKRWVSQSHQVTIFCGNDSRSLRNEVIDGVQIYRRGGLYMVYVWAFLYHIFKFRGKYDVIIDCENGIPFFTPLFAREKKFLLIHHVHQEVFLTDLKFPLAQLGRFLEGVAMPFVYRNSKVITISESSRQAIEKLGLGKNEEISIINPGVDLNKFQTTIRKTSHPSILYLGRLKPYKSLDRLIGIMEQIKEQVPGVILTIAGEGESRVSLERMVKKLGLESVVRFIGRVTEEAKVELYAAAWAVIQPSRIEGWGITIIEANAAGTTVIASDVPGLRDSVQNPHTGLLVTWDNQEKWVDSICKVLKDKQFRSFLETNSKKWVKQFTWEKSSSKLMKLLKD